MLRGRYQHTRVQAGPEHNKDHTRGREGRQDRDRNHNKRRQTTKETTGPAQAQRGAQKTRKTTRRNSRSTKTAQTHEPSRATHARKHKTAKEKKGSTDKTSGEQSALDLRKAKSELKTEKEEGRAAKQDKKQQNELEEYECTCHVYGQTHKSRENLAQIYTWENKPPVHLSRLWTDTPVEMKTQANKTSEGLTGHGGANIRSRPGQKGPHPTDKGDQKRNKN